jgi:hypothetical protein
MYCLFEIHVGWNPAELKYLLIYYRRAEQINMHRLTLKLSMDTVAITISLEVL